MPGRVDYLGHHDTWHWFRANVAGPSNDARRQVRAICHQHFQGNWSDRSSFLTMNIFVEDDRDAMTLRLHLADARYESKDQSRKVTWWGERKTTP